MNAPSTPLRAGASPYRDLFAALDEAEEVQTCIASVADLCGTDCGLDARMNGARDRLATLLGFLHRQHRQALDGLRDALHASDPEAR
ncbi:MAG: hypothetical protein JSS41_11850 [Proteobacteria bacterium]|nr:hypothetical protein [Pseudomonadota bacterium]